MKRPEQFIQQGVFSNLIPLMHLQKYSQFMAFQIRNETGVGGKKGAILGKIAKSMGTMAGVSDTLFIFPEREQQKVLLTIKTGPKEAFRAERIKIPPKTVFVEFKPLKGENINPETLLNGDQKLFKARTEGLGVEYRIIAARDSNDALKQVYSLLRENGVTV